MAWTTTQAAEAAGMTPAAFRRLAARARASGVELQADRSTWPNGKAPVYDETAVRGYLATRPGKGVGGGRPRQVSPSTTPQR